jgi:hypothetical protein
MIIVFRQANGGWSILGFRFLKFTDLIAAIKSLGGEAAESNHERFASHLGALLALNPEQVPDRKAWRDALAHGFAYYFWRWDKRAVQHSEAVAAAILRCWHDPITDTDLLCELLEFHYFLVWCFSGSSTEQCRRGERAMRAASEVFARNARTPPSPPRSGKNRHIVWLAMFATADDPMSSALRHVAPALLAHKDRFRLSVIAWRSPQPAFIDWLRSQGVTVHTPEANTSAGMIAAIEALVSADPAAIVISDMNNAIPTALFARRLGAAQVFLQGGMPLWPVRPLDGVFNSFGFDPETAAWGKARIMSFNPPWDHGKLNPPEKPDEIAAERARLPQGVRLIGNYGRLVKVTRPCLEAAEQILMRRPDVAFVTGGSGDPAELRAFIAASPVGDRMTLIEGFVPGHSWGRLLDLFLDTWPVTGGESCREVMAKGRPVITMHSEEMPAIDNQRDRSLVAQTWDEYAQMAIRLLTDPEEYVAACARAEAFANFMVDGDRFSTQLVNDLDNLLDEVRVRSRSRLSSL